MNILIEIYNFIIGKDIKWEKRMKAKKNRNTKIKSIK